MKKIVSTLCIVVLTGSMGVMQALDVVVTSNQDPAEAGKTTLRDAINMVNASGDATNSISFNLGGADPVIFLDINEGQLPTIVNQVTLNGIDNALQQMVFVDGTNILVGGSEVISLSGLHFSDNGSGTSAADSIIQNIGIQNFTSKTNDDILLLNGIFINGAATNCIITGCVIQNFTSASRNNTDGITISTDTGAITNNTVENIEGQRSTGGINITGADINGNCSGNLMNNIRSSESGSIGIRVRAVALKRSSIIGTIKGNFHNNRVTNIIGGGVAQGVFIEVLEGDCTCNSIDSLEANSNLQGLRIEQLNGNCGKNTIANLSSQDAGPTGIFIDQIATGKSITCNTIKNCNGSGADSPGVSLAGILIFTGDNILISHNSITNITETTQQVGSRGIIAFELTNSLIAQNNISNITGLNNNGDGIKFLSQSIGNDILSNSIFDINGKAINIVESGLSTDALVLLNSVTCSTNCKLTIRGQLLPNPHLATDQFLLQFFASPSNNPSEIKTVIGQYTHNVSQGNAFEVDLVPFVPTEFGQYLTATATALVEEPEQNINTSEVSNALRLCTVQNNPLCAGCPAPEKPPVICPGLCFVAS